MAPTPRIGPRRPGWAWLIAIFCGVIALFAPRSHWVLGIIGLGAALTVLNIAGSYERPERHRLIAALCVAGVSWAVFLIASLMIVRLR